MAADNSFRNLVESINNIDEGKKPKHWKGTDKGKPKKNQFVGEENADYGFLSKYVAEEELEEDLVAQMKREMSDYIKSRKEVEEEGSKPRPFNHTKPLGGKDLMAKKGVKTIRSKEDGALIDNVNEAEQQLNEFWGELAATIGISAVTMYIPLAIIDWLTNRGFPHWETITPRALYKKFKEWRHDKNFKKAFATLKDDPELMDFLNDDSNFKKSSHYLMPGKQKIFFNMVRSKMEALGFDHTPEREMNDAKRQYRRHKVAKDRHEKYGEPMESSRDQLVKKAMKPITDKEKMFPKKDMMGPYTPTAEELAEKHGKDVAYIEKQIAKGVAIEKEHTDDEAMANEIARDHIAEMPDYYEKLDKMEEGTTWDAIKKGASDFWNDNGEVVSDKEKQMVQKMMKAGIGRDDAIRAARALLESKQALREYAEGMRIKIKGQRYYVSDVSIRGGQAACKLVPLADGEKVPANNTPTAIAYMDPNTNKVMSMQSLTEDKPMPSARDEIASQMADMNNDGDITAPDGMGDAPYAVVTYYQYMENYGDAENPYWKPKGGGTAVHAKDLQTYEEAQKEADRLSQKDIGHDNPMSSESHDEPQIVPMRELDFDAWYVHDYT